MKTVYEMQERGFKALCDSGIVEGREEGKWAHYRFSRQESENAIALLREITAVQESGDAESHCRRYRFSHSESGMASYRGNKSNYLDFTRR